MWRHCNVATWLGHTRLSQNSLPWTFLLSWNRSFGGLKTSSSKGDVFPGRSGGTCSCNSQAFSLIHLLVTSRIQGSRRGGAWGCPSFPWILLLSLLLLGWEQIFTKSAFSFQTLTVWSLEVTRTPTTPSAFVDSHSHSWAATSICRFCLFLAFFALPPSSLPAFLVNTTFLNQTGRTYSTPTFP